MMMMDDQTVKKTFATGPNKLIPSYSEKTGRGSGCFLKSGESNCQPQSEIAETTRSKSSFLFLSGIDVSIDFEIFNFPIRHPPISRADALESDLLLHFDGEMKENG